MSSGRSWIRGRSRYWVERAIRASKKNGTWGEVLRNTMKPLDSSPSDDGPKKGYFSETVVDGGVITGMKFYTGSRAKDSGQEADGDSMEPAGWWTIPGRYLPKSDRNCAVRERTGDGVSVGRCWFHTAEDNDILTCPRHGDVTEIQSRFSETGELGEDPRDAPV